MFGDSSTRKLWKNKVNRDFDEIRKGRAEIKDLMAEGYFGGWDDAVSEIDRTIQRMLDDEYPCHDGENFCHDGDYFEFDDNEKRIIEFVRDVIEKTCWENGKYSERRTRQAEWEEENIKLRGRFSS